MPYISFCTKTPVQYICIYMCSSMYELNSFLPFSSQTVSRNVLAGYLTIFVEVRLGINAQER